SEGPVGKWYSDGWLRTTLPTTPRVRVPVTVEIESALSITPSTVVMGQLKAGMEAERKVIIRGIRPFRITGVKGVDAELTVHASEEDSRSVHILTIPLKPQKAADLQRTLPVLTDLKEEGEIDFQARAQVLP